METYVLTGRLSADCEVKHTQNGKQIITFQIPIDQSYTPKGGAKVQKTKWVRCQWWTESQTIANYLKKGTVVSLIGEPFASAYLNKNGEAVANLEVKVFSLKLEGGATEKQATQQLVTEHENYNPELLAEQADDLPF